MFSFSTFPSSFPWHCSFFIHTCALRVRAHVCSNFQISFLLCVLMGPACGRPVLRTFHQALRVCFNVNQLPGSCFLRRLRTRSSHRCPGSCLTEAVRAQLSPMLCRRFSGSCAGAAPANFLAAFFRRLRRCSSRHCFWQSFPEAAQVQHSSIFWQLFFGVCAGAACTKFLAVFFVFRWLRRCSSSVFFDNYLQRLRRRDSRHFLAAVLWRLCRRSSHQFSGSCSSEAKQAQLSPFL